MRERIVFAVFRAVKLREYEVPDFEETVAVAAYAAGRRTAAAFFAEVDEDFRVRTARTAADFPEIIFQFYDVVRIDIRFSRPDFICFIIVRINGRPEFIFRQFHFFCQKLPCPTDGIVFEIIAEGEIAEHFKIRMMTGSAADIFNIARTDAALARRNACARRLHFAGEISFKRSHAGAYHQKARVIVRN